MEAGRENLLIVGISRTLGFGPAHDHLAPHEGLIVEDLHCAFGFFDCCHFDKPVALGLVGITIVDDFNVSYRTYALEKLLQFILGSIIGEVTEV